MLQRFAACLGRKSNELHLRVEEKGPVDRAARALTNNFPPPRRGYFDTPTPPQADVVPPPLVDDATIVVRPRTSEAIAAILPRHPAPRRPSYRAPTPLSMRRASTDSAIEHDPPRTSIKVEGHTLRFNLAALQAAHTLPGSRLRTDTATTTAPFNTPDAHHAANIYKSIEESGTSSEEDATPRRTLRPRAKRLKRYPGSYRSSRSTSAEELEGGEKISRRHRGGRG